MFSFRLYPSLICSASCGSSNVLRQANASTGTYSSTSTSSKAVSRNMLASPSGGGSSTGSLPQRCSAFRVTASISTPRLRRCVDNTIALALASFGGLPFPVAPTLCPSNAAQSLPRSPLRVTSAGVMRREKGKRQLATLVRGVWRELSAGSAQLLVQMDRMSLRRHLPPSFAAQVGSTRDVADPGSAPIVAVKFPLDADQYHELIRRSGIGLFLYDSERYHARCSGVLVELLALGVPVVVPGGSWLADQVHEANYERLNRLVSTAAVLAAHRDGELSWSESRADLSSVRHREAEECSFREPAAGCSVPLGAASMVVQVDWSAGARTGYDVLLETTAFDAAGRALSNCVQTIGQPRRDQLAAALVRLGSQATRLEMRLRYAFRAQEPIDLRRFSVHFLPDTLPLGAVGLVAASTDQFPALLREMVQHYAHYRRSAIEFSQGWRARHAPSETVRTLLGNELSADLSAA